MAGTQWGTKQYKNMTEEETGTYLLNLDLDFPKEPR